MRKYSFAILEAQSYEAMAAFVRVVGKIPNTITLENEGKLYYFYELEDQDMNTQHIMDGIILHNDGEYTNVLPIEVLDEIQRQVNQSDLRIYE